MRLSSWSVPTASIRPRVEQDDAVGDLNRRQAMRNQERRAVLGEFLDGFADQHLILDIDGAGRLVEDQDGGIAKHGASQRDSLALTAGKPVAPLADQRCRSPGATP